MDAKDFLMVGDSWGLGMKKYFPTNTSVVSSGLFTRGSLPSAADQIKNSNYSHGVIIVHSGGNDIGMRGPKKNGKSLVADDVRQTINAAKAKGCKVIFVAAPWLNHTSTNVTNNRDKYNSWLKEAALSNGASYIDTSSMLNYMQQHQPTRGNFHLNDYSGYANYILKEAQKLVSNTPQQSKQNININWRSEKPNKVNRWGNPGKEYANTNAMALMNFLINKGLSLEAAAGIAGNLMSESGLNPYNYVSNDVNGPSGGIAMWHNNRLNKLKQFANKRGKAWTDIATQAEYLWHELTDGGYKHVLNKLKNVKTIEDASFIWGDEFEVFAGHQYKNGKNHIARRNNAINFANEYKKYNHTLPQYAQMSETPVNQNNQQNIDNNTQTDNWDIQSMYSTPVVNNFDRTFFPIIDTYLENNSKYKIKDSKKKVYSTVDYYDIISNSMQNNTKFQEGGSITSTIGTKLDKVQIPEFNTLDYAEIIRKVWNNSNGFVKLEDNPVVFGDGLDFSKFNINTEDNYNQNVTTDSDQSNVSTGSNQSNETSTQLSSNQTADERNLISDLNFKENEYTILDINRIVGSSLPENLESDFDFNNSTDWNKFNMKTLDELLKYIRNYPNAKEHPQEAVQGFSKDLLTLLIAYDMYKKGVTTTDEDYSIFDTPKQQSGGVITKNKKFSMGHPEDIGYEDDIYYNPPKESTTKKGDWNNEYEEIYYVPSKENKPSKKEEVVVVLDDTARTESQEKQTPVIIINDYRGKQPVSKELDAYLENIKNSQNNDYLSFAQAFKQARNSKLKTFTWRGKVYTTQLAKNTSRRKTYTHKKNKRK